MLYPRGTTYNINDTVDTNNTLELSATFDTFQEFWDYKYDLQAIRLAISGNQYDFSINKSQQLNIFVKKVDTL